MKTIPTKNSKYCIKNLDLTFKLEDLDEGSRKVKGYLSAFGVEDSERDIIYPGSFAKSVSERGPNANGNRRIAFLRMHNWEKQIGKFLELTEDNFGLKFVAQMGRSSDGENALLDYQDELIREHSIGFRYVDGKIEYDEEEGVYGISEVDLYEGSAVTFGANPMTPTIGAAKGLQNENYFATLSSELEAVTKALKNGKGTDERLYELEMRLRMLNQKYTNFFEAIKPGRENPTLEDEKVEIDPHEQARKFYIQLLSK